MQKTVKEIAELIDGKIEGEEELVITGISGIKEALEGDITFVANPKYLPLVGKTRASAIITSFDLARTVPKTFIRTHNPSLAFAKLISLLRPQELTHPKGIHPTVILAKSAKLGKNISIGAYSVIEEDVSIGDNTVIYPHTYIGKQTKIGKDCLIYSHVSIRERISIGDRVIIHSGTVIGSDGFGYVTVDGIHHKIPQMGIVEIGDDVEIGANVTIDRARFEKTLIGSGTKIDNLVQIAHNVVIGENSIIVAQVGISGSTVIGKNVTLAGQVGVVGHISIGDGAVVAAQSGVSKSIPAFTTVWGYPAKPMETAKRINACIQNLPRLYKHVEEIKRKIEELERRI
ncbi:MAG: UDP-3-O-(3-hydroxymyristoyl)glucosamine N-acyltransferase [Candidatus Omnitrophica bacterium]|nr:UDP-3-O-(3-hydroxymyristoyl)glucosamine N-acyltransferase [Candidatus Omnitrophota bacterium]